VARCGRILGLGQIGFFKKLLIIIIPEEVNKYE
jgi:hypothetical protein